MPNETKTLSFSIDGSFITKLAKEWLFLENKPYEKVEELLLSCMCGTNESQAQLKIHAQNILLGRAEFQGNSGDGSFKLVYLDDHLNDNNVFTKYGELSNKYKELEERFNETNSEYIKLIECLENWEAYDELDVSDLGNSHIRQLLVKIDKSNNKTYTYWNDGSKEVHVNTGSSMLDSYLKAQKQDVKYGWLDPTGKFYESSWGCHQSWVYYSITYGKDGYGKPDITEGKYELTDLSRYYDEYLELCNGFIHAGYEGGDFLTKKGWFLIHSPANGIPVITSDTSRRLTKAQREFLFDYYTDLKEPVKASEILNDGDF